MTTIYSFLDIIKNALNIDFNNNITFDYVIFKDYITYINNNITSNILFDNSILFCDISTMYNKVIDYDLFNKKYFFSYFASDGIVDKNKIPSNAIKNFNNYKNFNKLYNNIDETFFVDNLLDNANSIKKIYNVLKKYLEKYLEIYSDKYIIIMSDNIELFLLIMRSIITDKNRFNIIFITSTKIINIKDIYSSDSYFLTSTLKNNNNNNNNYYFYYGYDNIDKNDIIIDKNININNDTDLQKLYLLNYYYYIKNHSNDTYYIFNIDKNNNIKFGDISYIFYNNLIYIYHYINIFNNTIIEQLVKYSIYFANIILSYIVLDDNIKKDYMIIFNVFLKLFFYKKIYKYKKISFNKEIKEYYQDKIRSYDKDIITNIFDKKQYSDFFNKIKEYDLFIERFNKYNNINTNANVNFENYKKNFLLYEYGLNNNYDSNNIQPYYYYKFINKSNLLDDFYKIINKIFSFDINIIKDNHKLLDEIKLIIYTIKYIIEKVLFVHNFKNISIYNGKHTEIIKYIDMIISIIDTISKWKDNEIIIEKKIIDLRTNVSYAFLIKLVYDNLIHQYHLNNNNILQNLNNILINHNNYDFVNQFINDNANNKDLTQENIYNYNNKNKDDNNNIIVIKNIDKIYNNIYDIIDTKYVDKIHIFLNYNNGPDINNIFLYDIYINISDLYITYRTFNAIIGNYLLTYNLKYDKFINNNQYDMIISILSNIKNGKINLTKDTFFTFIYYLNKTKFDTATYTILFKLVAKGLELYLDDLTNKEIIIIYRFFFEIYTKIPNDIKDYINDNRNTNTNLNQNNIITNITNYFNKKKEELTIYERLIIHIILSKLDDNYKYKFDTTDNNLEKFIDGEYIDIKLFSDNKDEFMRLILMQSEPLNLNNSILLLLFIHYNEINITINILQKTSTSPLYEKFLIKYYMQNKTIEDITHYITTKKDNYKNNIIYDFNIQKTSLLNDLHKDNIEYDYNRHKYKLIEIQNDLDKYNNIIKILEYNNNITNEIKSINYDNNIKVITDIIDNNDLKNKFNEIKNNRNDFNKLNEEMKNININNINNIDYNKYIYLQIQLNNILKNNILTDNKISEYKKIFDKNIINQDDIYFYSNINILDNDENIELLKSIRNDIYTDIQKTLKIKTKYNIDDRYYIYDINKDIYKYKINNLDNILDIKNDYIDIYNISKISIINIDEVSYDKIKEIRKETKDNNREYDEQINKITKGDDIKQEIFPKYLLDRYKNNKIRFK